MDEKQDFNGQSWTGKRIDRLEREHEKLSDRVDVEIHRLHDEHIKLREENRIFHENMQSTIKSLERNTVDLPKLLDQFYKSQGVRDGMAWLFKTIIAIGALVSAGLALYALFSGHGDNIVP